MDRENHLLDENNPVNFMPASVHIENVSKHYGNVSALENISFSVEKGSLFGLIGPDGSGKTSLFRILVSLLIPDSGQARVEGYDVVKDYKAIRKIMGYMPGRFSLYYDLTVEENLTFFATIFGTSIAENYDLIKDIYVQIEPFKKRRAGQLSGGMKQKLALSRALIHKPTVLILDEPTTGVDAVSRKEFWDMLKRLKEQGITILVSTPYMDEAELCDTVALMQEGRILGISPPSKIVQDFDRPLYGVSGPDMIGLLSDLRNLEMIRSAFRFGDSIHITLSDQAEEKKLIKELEAEWNASLVIKPIEPSIEDCFMALMHTET
jgi:ABC-type multidrug transport system ATPase subunit